MAEWGGRRSFRSAWRLSAACGMKQGDAFLAARRRPAGNRFTSPGKPAARPGRVKNKVKNLGDK